MTTPAERSHPNACLVHVLPPPPPPPPIRTARRCPPCSATPDAPKALIVR